MRQKRVHSVPVYLALLLVGFTSHWDVAISGGELLPHHFTLTPPRTVHWEGRYIFCCTFRRITPPGCYPAPNPFGARTFLSRSGIPTFKSRPSATDLQVCMIIIQV